MEKKVNKLHNPYEDAGYHKGVEDTKQEVKRLLGIKIDSLQPTKENMPKGEKE